MLERSRTTLPLEALRTRLTKMTDRIIFRLQDRSTFPLNPSVYIPDAVEMVGEKGTSLLEYSLKGLERYHATLGRFEYPDQYPIMSEHLPSPGVLRQQIGIPELHNVDINLKNSLIPFYCNTLLPQLCENSDDPDTYGETVYLDADALELLNERINIGRYVAESKLISDPSIKEIIDDSPALLERLRDTKREEIVINNARKAASRYGLDEDKAEMVFRWIIEETIGLEVNYLQKLPLKS